MNPTGLLVPTVVAASRAPPSVPSVRCSSTRAPACTNLCPPLVPGSAGNAADVTTARLERSLRLGTWQEGKRSVPQATWFLPLLLFARNLLALCALVHVFLDGWTELPSCQVAKLPSCQIGELADEPFAAALSLGAAACGQCTVPSEEFQLKTNASRPKTQLAEFCLQPIF